MDPSRIRSGWVFQWAGKGAFMHQINFDSLHAWAIELIKSGKA